MKAASLTLVLIPALTLPATTRLPAADPAVTFYEQIQPIIFGNCSSCHHAGETAPFSLVTYSDVSRKARTIQRVINDQYMPPWHAESRSHTFVDDRRLDPKEIALFNRWVEQGKAEGDPDKSLPQPVFTRGWHLGKPDIILKMAAPFNVPADGPDIYRNFVLPMNIPDDKWIKAIELHPSAPSVMHHSLYFLDTSGTAVKRDGTDGQPGFRGMSFRKCIALGGYVPGVTPRKLPGDLARPLPKGSDLILASHFHPSGKPEKEQTTVGIYLADSPPTRNIATIQVPPGFGRTAGIDIAPGEKNFQIQDQYTIPADVEAVCISGHAHYICETMKMTATYPEGKVEDLLNIPDWDLDWQDTYYFQDHIVLPRGTILTTTIKYNNSDDNPDNPFSPPRRIKWGRQSTDEMGSITLTVAPVHQAGEKMLTVTKTLSQAKMVADLARELQKSRVLDRLPQIVNSLDKNGDGNLSKEELPSRLRNALLLRLDKDGDENLNPSEIESLHSWLRNLRNSRKTADSAQ